jgi:hypothetical protein
MNIAEADERYKKILEKQADLDNQKAKMIVVEPITEVCSDKKVGFITYDPACIIKDNGVERHIIKISIDNCTLRFPVEYVSQVIEKLQHFIEYKKD